MVLNNMQTAHNVRTGQYYKDSQGKRATFEQWWRETETLLEGMVLQ